MPVGPTKRSIAEITSTSFSVADVLHLQSNFFAREMRGSRQNEFTQLIDFFKLEIWVGLDHQQDERWGQVLLEKRKKQCRILISVVPTNFRQVLGLKVFLDPFRGLIMTFFSSYKKPLLIWRQRDFGYPETGECPRETVGVLRWRFLCTEMRGGHNR